MTNKDNAPEKFIFMNVRQYTGIDIDGQIAIPTNELKMQVKKGSSGWLEYTLVRK